ncbi:MAG: glutaredoxin 3 [Gammaproteobacteria bacterium]
MTGATTRVEMYLTPYCPYCMAAVSLLHDKGVTWEEIRVDREPEKRREMEIRSRRRTVPQIFIGGRHIGGFDDLRALDLAGELDSLLAGSDETARNQTHPTEELR